MKIAVLKRFASGVALLALMGAATASAQQSNKPNAAAQTVKNQCLHTCRARYRDCRHLNQLPSFECRDVYRDCTRYTCTGLGPG
jgi:hypothetical protein